MSTPAATYETILASVREKVAGATSPADLWQLLSSRTELETKAFAEAVSLERIPEQLLSLLASSSRSDVRRAILRNPHLTDEQLSMVIRDGLRFVICSYDDFEGWIRDLWHLLPDRGDVVRRTLCSVALRETSADALTANAVARALMRIDSTLTAEDLLCLLEASDFHSILVTQALHHPSADPKLWDALLESKAKNLLSNNLFQASLVDTTAIEYKPIREALIPVATSIILSRLAPFVEADEVVFLLRRARALGMDELGLLAKVPAERVTPEAQAFLLQHPDANTRLARVLNIARTRCR